MNTFDQFFKSIVLEIKSSIHTHIHTRARAPAYTMRKWRREEVGESEISYLRSRGDNAGLYGYITTTDEYVYTIKLNAFIQHIPFSSFSYRHHLFVLIAVAKIADN